MSVGVGLCRQTKRGASGSEPLVAGERVPARVREPASDVDLGDLGAALLAEPPLVALVTLSVDGALGTARPRLCAQDGSSARTGAAEQPRITGWANPPDQIGSALDDLFSPILLEVKR
jgi:hypothetical protein